MRYPEFDTRSRYFCMEDNIHEIIVNGTNAEDGEICFDFDDTNGDAFSGCAPIVDVFHTAAGEIYGAPSPAPTMTPLPTIVPSPSPTTIPSPLPSNFPSPRPTWESETELVTISTSLTLVGVSSSDWDSAAQKAFKKSVAASLDDADADDITNLEATSTSRRRRLMRRLLSSGLEVDFDISVDTESTGATNASNLFHSVVSDLTNGVASGDIQSALSNADAFDGLDVKVANYTEPTTYTAAYVDAPTPSPKKKSNDDDDDDAALAWGLSVPLVLLAAAAAAYYYFTSTRGDNGYDPNKKKSPGTLSNGSQRFTDPRSPGSRSSPGPQTPVSSADVRIEMSTAPNGSSPSSPSNAALRKATLRAPSGINGSQRGTPVLMNANGETMEIHRSPASPVPAAQMKTWRKLYDAMDTNNDGIVTHAELAKSVKDSAKDPGVYRQLQEELGIPDSVKAEHLHDSDVLERVFEAIDVDQVNWIRTPSRATASLRPP